MSSRRTWAIEAVGRPLVEDEGVVNGLGHPLFRDDVFVIRIQTASEQPSCVASYLDVVGGTVKAVCRKGLIWKERYALPILTIAAVAACESCPHTRDSQSTHKLSASVPSAQA